MDEDKKIENDHPASGQKSADKREIEYREISKEELEQILDDHEKWLSSDGKEGQNAELMGYDLKNADFFGRKLKKIFIESSDLTNKNFTEMDLRESLFLKVNLHGATFWNSDLTGAIFQLSDLSNAVLWRAKVNDANLNDVNLQNSKLNNIEGLSTAKIQHADFRGATGLFGNEFSQNDLTGVKLPDEIKEFKALEIVKETSQNARKIFFAMLLGCVYSWLTIATTTDVKLLTNTASSPLPIIGTEIPIAWFYIAAPLVLICLYFYFHLYLIKLWEALSGLPAKFPDGKRLDEIAYPWLLNGLVRRHFELLRKDRPFIAHVQELLSIFLAWWVVPITMMAFWLRYLVRHDLSGTIFHGVITITIFLFSLFFYNSCRIILEGNNFKKVQSEDLYRIKLLSTVVISICVLIPVSMYGFNGWGANLREKDISIKPSDYYKIDSTNKQIDSIKGANLKGRNLSYADMEYSFLIKSDLRGANLKEANLKNANLQNSDLRDGNLQNANLLRANLKNANLWGANLKNAKLFGANLQGANFIPDFSLIYSMYYDMNSTEIRDKWYSKLQTIDLTVTQLCSARTLYQANIEETLKQKVKIECPHLLEKP